MSFQHGANYEHTNIVIYVTLPIIRIGNEVFRISLLRGRGGGVGLGRRVLERYRNYPKVQT
jgi:hypothetical protein